jgi:hypothetical protein
MKNSLMKLNHVSTFSGKGQIAIEHALPILPRMDFSSLEKGE